MIESTPVSGVEIKKLDVGPFFTPAFLKVTADGITEHEQSGRGIPKREAFTISPIVP
tara:strand:+ start:348 stop:518 length:171 start_codon:yes stop_codon:yes gene_type:complete